MVINLGYGCSSVAIWAEMIYLSCVDVVGVQRVVEGLNQKSFYDSCSRLSDSISYNNDYP